MSRGYNIGLGIVTVLMFVAMFLYGFNVGTLHTLSKLRETAGPVRCSGAMIIARDFGGGSMSARCGGGR